MEQIIQKSLAGRRFALMGFEAAEADSIIAALGTVRGIGHVTENVSGIPGLHSLAPFDACFINASAIGAAHRPAPIETIARSRKSAIIIGTYGELLSGFAAIADLNRDFIVRPYLPDELLIRAHRILRFAETTAAAIQTSLHNGARRVVVADDDATTIIMISTILKHFHYHCDIARNGTEALEIARKKRPDLVLLDVSMPEMNGFEALTALRSDVVTRSTPVIIVSGHRDEAEVVKGFSLGADDYVTKPFNSGELMARISRVFREPYEF